MIPQKEVHLGERREGIEPRTRDEEVIINPSHVVI